MTAFTALSCSGTDPETSSGGGDGDGDGAQSSTTGGSTGSPQPSTGGGAPVNTGGNPTDLPGTGGSMQGSGGTGGLEGGTGGGENGTGGGATGGAGSEGDGPIGWASVSACGPQGTTGGGDGPSVTVSSGDELRSALESDGPQVIYLEGTVSGVGGVEDVEDKTVIGMNGAEITGGIHLQDSRNVIFKNIEFSDGSNDTFEMSRSECIWFDHCAFRDGSDGNLDIVRGSDLITVSWSKFYYTEGHGHMLSNLCGNSNNRSEDEGKMNITFHHNWWGAGVRSRQPRVRYGEVHVFNNYYHYTPVSGDGGHVGTVAAGQHSKLLVENNYFEGSENPIYFQSDEGTAEVVHRGNEFDGTSGDTVSRGSSFTPPYEYTLESATEARQSVMTGAGPQ